MNVSPMVAAVVSAPAVRLVWLAFRAASRLVRALASCWALRCSGPVASQLVMESMVAASWISSAGRPLTKVITTKVSNPPRIARPPMSTTAVAGPRGTPRAVSSATAGASSAASSTAIATGTTSAARWPTTTPATYSAAAITSSRQPRAAATRRARGTTSLT